MPPPPPKKEYILFSVLIQFRCTCDIQKYGLNILIRLKPWAFLKVFDSVQNIYVMPQKQLSQEFDSIKTGTDAQKHYFISDWMITWSKDLWV